MKPYRVLSPLTHDRKDYAEGDKVHLEARVAEALKRARVVTDMPDDQQPEAQEQDTCVSGVEGGADSAPPEAADDRSVRRARRGAA